MGSITIKKYFKSPILLVSTVVFFLYMFFWLIRVRQYLPVNAISQVLHTQEISFLFFLFVSYEFLVKAKKDNCEELLGSIKHAKLKDIMCALIWLILEMIILCIGIFYCSI
jgi:DMSO/TMAO reductase YedYZ heme-binding membrane subunit